MMGLRRLKHEGYVCVFYVQRNDNNGAVITSLRFSIMNFQIKEEQEERSWRRPIVNASQASPRERICRYSAEVQVVIQSFGKLVYLTSK